MRKQALLMVLLLIPVALRAQWHIGVVGGFGNNHYTSDEHYLSDMYNESEQGVTAGIAGQYDLKEWSWLHSRLGVRAELNYTQKNHNTLKRSDADQYATLVEYRNGSFQLPLMASLSFGWVKTRFFVNLGGYGNYTSTDSDYERKFNCGGLAGIGVGYSWRKWTLQGELRGYADAISATKDTRKLATPHYNTTLLFQVALFYNFK